MIREINTSYSGKEGSNHSNIVFTFDNDVIDIKGVSIPEDAREEWVPFLEILKEYIRRYSRLTFNFRISYFNTATSKYMYDMFRLLEDNYKTCISTINWYYMEDDEDSEAYGQLFKDTNKHLIVFLKSVKAKTL